MYGAINMELILALLIAWVVHELGHWLALRSLGLAGRLHNRWLFGVALEVPLECQSWRESYVAIAGPAANLLLMAVAWRVELPQLFAANLVVAAVNLLPFLPLDGGKALRGLLGSLFSWLAVSRFLLLLGKAAALAFVLVVYYFGLRRWLLLLAGWLYLVAWREEQNLPYLHLLRLLYQKNK